MPVALLAQTNRTHSRQHHTPLNSAEKYLLPHYIEPVSTQLWMKTDIVIDPRGLRLIMDAPSLKTILKSEFTERQMLNYCKKS
jgi:hypothetical protein